MKLNKRMIQEYSGRRDIVLPSDERPVVQFPMNDFEYEGAVEGNMKQFDEKGYDPVLAGAMPIYVESPKFFATLGGWKRALAFERFRKRLPNHKRVKEFEASGGFECIVLSHEVAFAGEDCWYLYIYIHNIYIGTSSSKATARIPWRSPFCWSTR